jgi:hypothetical protein
MFHIDKIIEKKHYSGEQVIIPYFGRMVGLFHEKISCCCLENGRIGLFNKKELNKLFIDDKFVICVGRCEIIILRDIDEANLEIRLSKLLHEKT